MHVTGRNQNHTSLEIIRTFLLPKKENFTNYNWWINTIKSNNNQNFNILSWEREEILKTGIEHDVFGAGVDISLKANPPSAARSIQKDGSSSTLY